MTSQDTSKVISYKGWQFAISIVEHNGFTWAEVTPKRIAGNDSDALEVTAILLDDKSHE